MKIIKTKHTVAPSKEETAAYAMGFHYGKHPNHTSPYADLKSEISRLYLWELYGQWLQDVRDVCATFGEFEQGFIRGVAALAGNKDNK